MNFGSPLTSMYRITCTALLAILMVSCTTNNDTNPLRLAVAANFAHTLRELCALYEMKSTQPFVISVGSTGGLAAQIEQGAPFDLFFAADRERPMKLESQGLGIAGTRRTYAEGKLVLWSTSHTAQHASDALTQDNIQHIALANPRTAPYGLAAQQFLERRGLWETIEPRLRYAQSTGQAQQFVASGAADWGFMAASMVNYSSNGIVLPIEQRFHDPIIQQMIILKDTPEIRNFWRWVQEHPDARKILIEAGYTIPEVQ